MLYRNWKFLINYINFGCTGINITHNQDTALPTIRTRRYPQSGHGVTHNQDTALPTIRIRRYPQSGHGVTHNQDTALPTIRTRRYPQSGHGVTHNQDTALPTIRTRQCRVPTIIGVGTRHCRVLCFYQTVKMLECVYMVFESSCRLDRAFHTYDKFKI
jgi:hypothetical protein